MIPLLRIHTVSRWSLMISPAFWKCWIQLDKVWLFVADRALLDVPTVSIRGIYGITRSMDQVKRPKPGTFCCHGYWPFLFLKSTIRDGEGFLLVYSITSRSTYDRIERFRDQIFRVKDVDNVPLMLVGNKCDKVTEREVTREEGYATAKRLACDFIETSAKTCVNVERSFYQVVKAIRAQREGLRAGPKGKPKKEKKKLCLIL